MTKGTESLQLSIVVPVYKSASTLQELHARIGEMAVNAHYVVEVIYVNDASPDASAAVLQSLPAYPPHRVFYLRENQGQSVALLSGIAKAGYDLFVTMDADLQDEPELIPRLAGELKNSDVIFATRSGQYEGAGRLATSFVFKSLVTLFSGGRIPYNAGLFLLGRTAAFRPFIPFLPEKPYLIGLIARFRLRCHAVTVQREKNRHGETSYTFRKRLRVARSFFRTLLTDRRSSDEIPMQWMERYLVEDKPAIR